MPEMAFMFIDGITEESYFSNVKGQEGSLLVLSFNHSVSSNVNAADSGRLRQQRHHGEVQVLTYMGRSTPEIYKHLVTGKLVKNIEVRFFRQPEKGSGDPQLYFKYIMTNCLFSNLTPTVSNVLEGGGSGAMLTLAINYETLTMESVTGGTAFMDDLKAG